MRKGRSIGIVSRFKNRQGFALILVFSLASIVLLIGLSLVSLTQVETASNQYDRGLRVARANARLALQMAIGDLQTLAGPDQRATATADGARTPTSDDFNDAADGSAGNVTHTKLTHLRMLWRSSASGQTLGTRHKSNPRG